MENQTGEQNIDNNIPKDWNDVIGQTQLTSNLRNAIAHQKISHAYIIQGEKYAGKKMIADIFARALQCEADGDKPCNQCRSCKQAINRNHPDIIYVSHDKPNVISVDNIREQINSDIAIKPYSGSHKIYIVDDAQKMNQQAQNALLKTLEEPPEYAIIILLATNVEMMLQTILSRCVVMNIKPISTETIKQYLMENVHIPDYLATVCASFARGNIGRAAQLAMNAEFEAMKNDVLNMVKNVKNMEFYQMSTLAKNIEEKKYDLNDFFDLCMIWYRDLLLVKSSNDRKHIIFTEELSQLKKQVNVYSYEGIAHILSEIEHARNRWKSNVNLQLTIETLLLEIQKVK